MALSRRRKWLMVVSLGGAACAMLGLAFAGVPLYRIFCQVTGYGGTTQVAAAAPEIVGDRVITVRFNADVARGMPWRFKPMQREIRVRLGESALAFFEAENRSDETVLGSATFNVTPQKAGAYFNKIDCFCFEEQVLHPGESAEMPFTFFIDPEILDNRNLDDVTTITLSYTFFNQGVEARDAFLREHDQVARRETATTVN